MYNREVTDYIWMFGLDMVDYLPLPEPDNDNGEEECQKSRPDDSKSES